MIRRWISMKCLLNRVFLCWQVSGEESGRAGHGHGAAAARIHRIGQAGVDPQPNDRRGARDPREPRLPAHREAPRRLG